MKGSAYLSAVEASKALGVTITEFHRAVKEGRLPNPINLGRRVWRKDQIDEMATAYQHEQEAGRN